MDELKNLVIQTLESKGILGQLRAKLRSCVFQVIDNQEQSLKQGSGFHWENPLASKILESPDGLIAAELIREFLEFYRMDYSLAVYLPECNLQEAKKKDELEGRLGLPHSEASQPLLIQLINAFKSGQRGAPSAARPGAGIPETASNQAAPPTNAGLSKPAEKPQFTIPTGNASATTTQATQNKDALDLGAKSRPQQLNMFDNIMDLESSQEDNKKSSDKHMFGEKKNDNIFGTDKTSAADKKLPEKKLPDLPPVKGGKSLPPLGGFGKKPLDQIDRFSDDSADKERKSLEEVDKKLEEIKKDEKKGTLAEIKKNTFNDVQKVSELAKSSQIEHSKSKEDDEYEQDFEEIGGEIEEDIEVMEDFGESDDFHSNRGGNKGFTDSGGITASQSLGVDASVDSVALESYDHVEAVERK